MFWDFYIIHRLSSNWVNIPFIVPELCPLFTLSGSGGYPCSIDTFFSFFFNINSHYLWLFFVLSEITEEVLNSVQTQLRNNNFDCWETNVGGNGVMIHSMNIFNRKTIPEFKGPCSNTKSWKLWLKEK
jgi:hypothetical protein